MKSSLPSHRWEWILAIGAVATGVLVGGFVVEYPELLTLDLHLSAPSVVGLGGVLVLAVAFLARPSLAAATLVALVYLNLSDVLIRAYGLPSLLQLLTLPIFISAWTHHGPGLLRRLLGEPLTWVLGGYALLALASSTWADQPALSDARSQEFLKAFVLYVLMVLLVTTPQRIWLISWTMVGAGALLGALGLVQLTLGAEDAFAGLARARYGQIYGDVFGFRLSGPLGDPNFFAQILLALVPVALVLFWESLSRRGRLWAGICLILILGATTMTYSRGGAIALVFVLVTSFAVHGLRRRRFAWLGVPFLLAAVLLIPREFRERITAMGELLSDDAVLVETDSSVEERMVLMGTAWEMLAANPILGVGAGNYTARFGEYAERFGSVARDYEDPDAVRYPHNLYLEVGAETGSVGLALFLGSLLLAFWNLGRGRARLLAVGEDRAGALARALQISLGGYLLSSLFLHGDFERYLWLFLGLAGALHAMGRLRVPKERGTGREA